MFLYIIRHGHFQRQVTPDVPIDTELTSTGVRQAELTGEWLRGKGIQLLYCSPAIRTLMTAQIIGGALQLKPRAWVSITEMGFCGNEPGLTGNQLRMRFPDIEIDDSFHAERGWAADISAESPHDIYLRAKRVEDELRTQYPVGSSSVALVTHNHFARYLIGSLLGLVQPSGWDRVINHNNCGVSLIEFRTDCTILHYANAHFHLGHFIT